MSGIELTAEQEKAVEWGLAFAYAEDGPREALLEGRAGTGKTTVAAEIMRRYEEKSVPCAPTHKAGKVFGEALGAEKATTIHSLMGLKVTKDREDKYLSRQAHRCPAGTKLILADETSMIGQDVKNPVREFVYQKGVKIIYIGDHGQLCPVVKRKPWERFKLAETSWVFTEVGHLFRLKQVVRHGGNILQAANVVYEMIDRGEELVDPFFFKQFGMEYVRQVGELGKRFMAAREKYGDSVRMFSWKNDNVDELNEYCRMFVHEKNELLEQRFLPGEKMLAAEAVIRKNNIIMHTDDEGVIVDVLPNEIRGEKETEGGIECNVVIGKNLSKSTGDFKAFVPTKIGKEKLKIVLKAWAARNKTIKDGRVRKVEWTRFHDFKDSFDDIRVCHGMTFHRSQGSTFDEVFVDMRGIVDNRDPMMALKILYVGMTRARRKVTFIG